jgi:hypothetical protein
MPWNPRRLHRSNYDPLLVPILDGFTMISVGPTKGYELIHDGVIETVLIGRRRYATLESLKRLATPADHQAAESREAFVTSRPPPMAKAKWSGHRRPRPKQEDKPGAA